MLESCRVGTHGLGHNVREMCIAVDNASQPHLDALRRYPSVHGVRGDTGDGLADVPGLLHVLATEHKRSAMFYGWAPLRWLDPTDTVEHDGFEDVLDDPEADLLIARSADGTSGRSSPISRLSTLAASTTRAMTTDGCPPGTWTRCDTSTAHWLSSSDHCLRGQPVVYLGSWRSRLPPREGNRGRRRHPIPPVGKGGSQRSLHRLSRDHARCRTDARPAPRDQRTCGVAGRGS